MTAALLYAASATLAAGPIVVLAQCSEAIDAIANPCYRQLTQDATIVLLLVADFLAGAVLLLAVARTEG